MLKPKDIRRIILKCKEGWPDTRIAEEFKISRNTVRKYRKKYWDAMDLKYQLTGENVSDEELAVIDDLIPNYDTSKRKPYKYTEEMDALLESIIDEEQERTEKGFSRASKQSIYERIVDSGFDIGYTTISRKIDEKRLKRANLSPWAKTDTFPSQEEN